MKEGEEGKEQKYDSEEGKSSANWPKLDFVGVLKVVMNAVRPALLRVLNHHCRL